MDTCKGLYRGSTCGKPITRMVPVPNVNGTVKVMGICSHHYAEMTKVIEQRAKANDQQ